MSVIETIEAFRSGLMWIGLSALVLCLVALLGCAISGKRHFCRFPWSRQARPSPEGNGEIAASLKPSRSVLVGIALLATGCTLFGGGKMRSGGGRGATALPGVTAEEIAQGWRLESVTTNDAVSYAMPTNGVEYAPWSRGGGYETHFPLDLGDFAFPFGTGVVRRLDVVSGGMVESLPRQQVDGAYHSLMSICAAREWASIVPGVGRFWWADAAASSMPPYRTKLLTWENVYAGRDRTGQYNAQIELRNDGNFTMRSNNLERVCRRVVSFDWDGDGLENSVDPTPFVAGADAHGTNVEWYNTVCSNVFSAVGCGGTGTTGILPVGDHGDLSWRVDVNSNAYYFVDIVTTNVLAPIYFIGDRASRLGNPVVVARAFETNHVPLLIGLDYAITSPVPFTVSYPMGYMYPELETNTPCRAHIRWPLEFTVSPDGGGYRVAAGPYDPGCEFQWDAPTRSVPCSYETDGGWIGFGCCGTGTCGCEGCSVSGVARLDDASFDLPSVWCGCWHNDPPDPGAGPMITNEPSVSVSFNKPVVFYEDAYTNAPGDVVARYSTNVTLAVCAYGGEAGGMFQLAGQNMSKLVRTGGKAISLPYKAFVPPNGGASFEVEYEAVGCSGGTNDITVTASYSADHGMSPPPQTARLTAIQVKIEADNDNLPGAPTNRHVFGVGETVKCHVTPGGVAVTLFSGGDVVWQTTNQTVWTTSMPYVNSDTPMPLRVSSNGENFQVSLQCLVPSNVVAINAEIAYCGGQTNKAGYAGIGFLMELHPKTVAFAGNVILREVPASGVPSDGTHEGYFATPAHSNNWYHTAAHGAGRWMHIKESNRISESDTASWTEECLPPWSNGYIIWRNPIAWRPASEKNLGDGADRVFCYKPQAFRIDEQGTLRVEKFGHEAHRAVTGDYWRDGVWIEWLSRMEKGE